MLDILLITSIITLYNSLFCYGLNHIGTPYIFHYLHFPLLAFSITCIFHYLHFPLPAISISTTLLAFSITCNFHPDHFTCIFHYLQFPSWPLYLHFPLLAISTPTILLAFSITCIFHYLHFPLLANSASPKSNHQTYVHVWTLDMLQS